MSQSTSKSTSERPAKDVEWDQLQITNPDAGGLDIGASEIYVAVPPRRDERTVRVFGTFTPDLQALADWLVACGIKTVAMESTGVYWIPIYEILEERGLDVQLINARHLTHVPGRKSDVQDCQWIQRLHSYGLLTGSFRPALEMRALRSYLRHRGMLLEYRAAHIQHMQKALQEMNLQLTQVLSDITGQTGMAILRAIVAGQHDPQILARLRHERCHATEADIVKALTGHYRAEHLFALQQALALYDFYTDQVQRCDEQVLQQYAAIKPHFPTSSTPDMPDGSDDSTSPPTFSPKRTGHSKNSPTFDVRAQLYRITGVDLLAVEGLNDSSAQAILAEIGTDMSKFVNEKHFCSWLGLAPHNDISGGKVLRSHTLSTNNRATHLFRLAAQSAGKTHSALGAFYRRMRARLGPQQAIIATAHKIARIVYRLLKHHMPYHDMGSEAYDARQRERELARLKRRATELGFGLTPLPT